MEVVGSIWALIRGFVDWLDEGRVQGLGAWFCVLVSLNSAPWYSAPKEKQSSDIFTGTT